MGKHRKPILPTSFLERLQALNSQFRAELPTRLESLYLLWEAWLRDRCDEDLEDFQRGVLHLARSSAIFGFTAISAPADALERQLGAQLPLPATPSSAVLDELDRLWQQLDRSAAAVLQHELPGARRAGGLRPVSPPRGEHAERHTVYLIDSGIEAEALAQQLNRFGYHTVLCARAPEQPAAPATAVFGIRAAAQADALFAQVEALHRQGMPVLVLSGLSDFDTRLRAVRAGADGFITPPNDTLGLLAQLDRYCHRAGTDAYRVLLVDADAVAAQYHTALLAEAGMTAASVADARALWLCIDEFAPDVIVADLQMPEINGPELACVLRQQERYDDIPIVFLAPGQDAGPARPGGVGGLDDILAKPVVPAQFAAALQWRAERCRRLRTAHTQDALTAVLNRKHIGQALQREFARSRRSGSPLSVVLIDVDDFTALNERHGHAVGDQLLRTLSRLLQRRLRSTDYVGRCGGDDFLLLMPDTPIAAARKVMDELLAAFAELSHESGHTTFTAAFSGGVAVSTLCDSGNALLHAAETALRRAAAEGGSRIAMDAAVIPAPRLL